MISSVESPSGSPSSKQSEVSFVQSVEDAKVQQEDAEDESKDTEILHNEALRELPIHLSMENLSEMRVSIEPTNVCLICGDFLAEDQVIVLDCLHSFCRSCISSFVELKICEGQVLRFNCPHHECTNELTPEQVEADLSEDLAKKYSLFKRNEELSRNQNLRWCSRPDCLGYDIGSLKKIELKCNTCGHDFCYYCGETPHGRKKCKAEADKLLDRWSRKNGVKYCPNCKRRVMKSAGCNHMTCPRCMYQWCWLCGERFHSFHFEDCSVIIAKTNNPPWFIILGLLFAPLLLPFVLSISVFVTLYKEFPEESDTCLHSFIRMKWLSLPLIFISSVILSPPIVAVMLAISGPVVLFEVRDASKLCRSFWIWGPLFLTFGFALSPIIICFVILMSVVAQFFGMGLILAKVLLKFRLFMETSSQATYAKY